MLSVNRNVFSTVCVTLLMLGFSTNVVAADSSYLQLKAAYLVNIARFVSWPEKDAASGVVLCLPQNSDLAVLKELLDGQPVGSDRNLDVRMPVGKLSDCNILYLDESSAKKTTFEAVRNSSHTLVVAETPIAWERGFAIQMYTRDLKLRLAINEAIVKDADYEMSSKLLRLYRRLN